MILFGIGSPLAIDVEESCWRLGYQELLGVRNLPGKAFVSGLVKVILPGELTEALRGRTCITPIFTPGHRLAAWAAAQHAGLSKLATVIDPTAVVARSSTVGAGTYINAGCIIAGAVAVGDHVIINRASSIGHHSRLSDWCSIGPGVTVAGLVTIGRGAVLGTGAVVLPDLTIGANAVVGAGAVVTRSVPDHCLVAGQPARLVQRNIPGYGGTTIESPE